MVTTPPPSQTSRRYIPEQSQHRTPLSGALAQLWDILNGPRQKPHLLTRIAVTIALLAIAALLTNVYWQGTGDQLILFYLIACVVATWYGGLGTGVVAVLAVSVMQLRGPIDGGAGWEVGRPSVWIRMLVVAGTAVSFALLWEALQSRKRELTAAIEELQTVIDLVPAAIAVAEDPDCRYIRINPTMAGMLGVPPGVIASVTGPLDEQPLNFRFVRDDKVIPGDQLPVQMAAKTKRRTPREQLDIVRDDGVLLHMVGEAVPLFDVSGELRGSVGAFADVTDWLKVQEELRAANHVKDEFLGLVSHELRTPITVVRGYAEILDSRGTLVDEESRAVAVHDIREEAERLSRLVDNLLVLSKLGLTRLEREPLLPGRIVEQVVGEHRLTQGARPLRVHGDAPLALGAPTAVEQIVNNLLTNAERYSAPEAPVDIDLREAGGEVEVAVRDHGPGIAAEESDQVFAAFYRSEDSQPGGVGIGLAVCKRLAEAQGGRIWARQPPDGGAEIVFTLPSAPAGLSALT